MTGLSQTLALLCMAASAVVSAAPGGIDFTVPEPKSASHIMRVELRAAQGETVTTADTQRAHHLLLERCRLLLPSRCIPPRLVRRDNAVYLHLYTPLAKPASTGIEQHLQTCLNHHPNTVFLRVHPRSEQLLQRADTRAAIARYEQAITGWMEGPRTTPPPKLPSLDIAGYMLAEYPLPATDGSVCYRYLVVRQPEVARNEDCLVTNDDIVSCRSIDDTSTPPHRTALELELTKQAAERFAALTRSIAADHGQLAIVSDGSVLCLLGIPTALGSKFRLYDNNPRALQLALLPPLPCRVCLSNRPHGIP